MKKRLRLGVGILLGFVFAYTMLLSSATLVSTSFASGGGVLSGDGGGVINEGSRSIINPIKSESIDEFLLKIIDVILIFALPIIILFIMYAGFLFVTARGEEQQISTARKALLWAIIGGVVVLGARLIISVIDGTIRAF